MAELLVWLAVVALLMGGIVMLGRGVRSAGEASLSGRSVRARLADLDRALGAE